MLKTLLFFYSADSNVMRVVRLTKKRKNQQTKKKGKSMEKCLNLFKGKVAYRKGVK